MRIAAAIYSLLFATACQNVDPGDGVIGTMGGIIEWGFLLLLIVGGISSLFKGGD
jgi:hypothetical protein